MHHTVLTFAWKLRAKWANDELGGVRKYLESTQVQYVDHLRVIIHHVLEFTKVCFHRLELIIKVFVINARNAIFYVYT
jgi:hypothetical protein